MSRKFIISEDERARILGLHETAKSNHGTVISEQSMGIGFMSGEPNGLKIKKDEPTEQVAPAQSQGLWKDFDGFTYKLPCVNSEEMLADFMNFGKGTLGTTVKTLENLGLKGQNMSANPLAVNVNWEERVKRDDPYAQSAEYIVAAISNGLKEFAKYNPKPETVKNLKIKSATGKDYTAEIIRMLPNYFDVLAKVAEQQKRALGC